jgi:hypothetical protein
LSNLSLFYNDDKKILEFIGSTCATILRTLKAILCIVIEATPIADINPYAYQREFRFGPEGQEVPILMSCPSQFFTTTTPCPSLTKEGNSPLLGKGKEMVRAVMIWPHCKSLSGTRHSAG